MVVLLGALGGLLPDLLRIAKAKGDLGQVGGANVLISMVVLAVIGAVASVVADNVDPNQATLISSVTAGFTGPEVISRIAGATTSGGGGRAMGAGGRGILGWWSV
jgi:hypothetical protein